MHGVYRIGDAYLPAGRAAVLVLAVLLIVAVVVFIRFTRPGLALQAISQDREAAALQGIDLRFMSAMGFALGAALAAIAGGLLITIFGMHAGAGTAVSIKAFLMITLHRTEPAMACQRGRLCGAEYTKGPAEKMATQPAERHPALMYAPKLNSGIAIARQQEAPADAAGRSRCCLES